MADEDNTNDAPSGLASKWKGLAGWQKAGVLIGGGALAVALLTYWQQKNSSGQDTGTSYAGDLTPGSSYRVGFPGQYDYYPSLPTTPTSGGTTGTTTTTTGPMFETVSSGWLASTPGGTNNKGKNLVNLPKGADLSYTGKKGSFNGNTYYQVSYNGQSGYVNAKTVGL